MRLKSCRLCGEAILQTRGLVGLGRLVRLLLIRLPRRIGEGRPCLRAVDELLLVIRLLLWRAIVLRLRVLPKLTLRLEVEACRLWLHRWKVLLHGWDACLLGLLIASIRLLLAGYACLLGLLIASVRLEVVVSLTLRRLKRCRLRLHLRLLLACVRRWKSSQLRLQRRRAELVLLWVKSGC